MSAPNRLNHNDAATSRRDWWRDSIGFVVTVAIIAASVSAAAPFQFLWFWGVFEKGGAPPGIGAAGAAIITLVIEGMTWHGAIYYFKTSDSALGWVYRIETVLFAVVAASANFAHGYMDYNWIVGMAYAVASLMGVGAWELHMLRTKQLNKGSLAERRLWRMRRKLYKPVVTEARRYRATFGNHIDWETAWRSAYVRIQGTPTVPVPATDEVAARILGRTKARQQRSAGIPDDEAPEVVDGTSAPVEDTSSEGGAPVLELRSDFNDRERFEDLIRNSWPELSETNRNDGDDTTASGSGSAHPGTSGTDPRGHSGSASGSGSGSSDATQELPERHEEGTAVPEGVPEAEPRTRKGPTRNTSGAVSSNDGSNSGIGSRNSELGGDRNSQRKSTTSRNSGRSPERKSAPHAEAAADVPATGARKPAAKRKRGGEVQIAPKEEELDASSGSALVRIGRYLTRVAERAPLEDLDRTFIEQQFGVSSRWVRKAFEAKAEPASNTTKEEGVA